MSDYYLGDESEFWAAFILISLIIGVVTWVIISLSQRAKPASVKEASKKDHIIYDQLYLDYLMPDLNITGSLILKKYY